MKIIRADAYRPSQDSTIENCEINYPFSSFYSKRPAYWIDTEGEADERQTAFIGPFDSFEEAEKELESILALD